MATFERTAPQGAYDGNQRRAQQDSALVRYPLIAAALVLLAWLIVIPVVNVFYEALKNGPATYWDTLVGDPDTLAAIKLTLTVAPVAVLLNILFGIAAAWAIARFRFRGRALLTSMIDLPFAISPVVAGLIFVLLFGLQGYFGEWLREHDIKILFATPGLIIVTSFVTLPFVARELIPLMEAIGDEEETAAVSLGARAWQLFWRVTLPNIKWGLLYGTILCNARAMGEFGAVYVVSGRVTGQTDTLPLRVEKLFQEYDQPASFVVASLLCSLALVTLGAKTFLEWRTRRELAARLEVPEDDVVSEGMAPGLVPALAGVAGGVMPSFTALPLRVGGGHAPTTALRTVAGGGGGGSASGGGGSASGGGGGASGSGSAGGGGASGGGASGGEEAHAGVGISVRGVTKRFGNFTALSNINLDVPDGTLLALLGPSGSGKTTLLRIIAGLELADEGTIYYRDEDATDKSPRNRNVGFVFQHYALFRHMSVFENVAFGLRVRKWPEDRIRKRVRELLDLVQLASLEKQSPAQLSGGQRQRIALARALAPDPKLLLLDEPFGALDARVRTELRTWLRKLHHEIGLTSVLVTHDQEEAFEVADRVVVMNHGRIEQAGTAGEIFEHPANSFVLDFLGNVNVFHGRVEAGRAHVGGLELSYPDYPHEVSRPAKAYVRPHELEIDRIPRGGSCLRGTLTRVGRSGAVIKAEVLSEEFGIPLAVEVAQDRWNELALEQGTTVYVFPKRLRVFVHDYQI
ncbi:MAG TPA: sulfate ABC transporter permease subunit CysW [Candidatus Limnocylindrales bacterium]|nr:sulfate ABC transporter permease subunit CysW [Candidatus Limnocylindrales bacterium]